METGNFTVSIPLNGNFSGLRDVNRKISGFHIYRNYPGIPVYATNFWIIPFPKWKFFSGKMETLPLSPTFFYEIITYTLACFTGLLLFSLFILVALKKPAIFNNIKISNQSHRGPVNLTLSKII